MPSRWPHGASSWSFTRFFVLVVRVAGAGPWVEKAPVLWDFGPGGALFPLYRFLFEVGSLLFFCLRDVPK